jgi:cation diffusion facilitator CzcD-associated flavoprotein CzcO
MVCQPTRTPSVEEIDIPALRERYRYERDKRLRSEGQDQYVRPTGGVVEDYVTDPYRPVEPRDALADDLDVAILGAGWSGIMAAYHLAKAGVTNFRNIDGAGDFGGVWYWNRYPGIQCDNDAYIYLPLLEETGFMPSRKFADGAEIQRYARLIAEKFDFADNALFHTVVSGLRWDSAIDRWRVTTNRGDEIRARFVIVASGVLNMPKLPSIPGIESFKGKMFHSARWDYAYTGGSFENPVLDKLHDKRVAIVGTGATAIQIVPHLGRFAGHLLVVQRTPSSVDERPNPPTDIAWAKSLAPGWQAQRQANFHRAAMEAFHPGDPDLICDIWTEVSRNLAAELESEGWPTLTAEEFVARREVIEFRVMERLRRRVDELVEDPAIAETLKPYYRFMCKRPLSSNDYYQTFNRPNVTLVDVSLTKGVEALTETGLIAGGKEIEVDCVIFASGFEVTSDLERRWGIDIIEGRDGLSLYKHWADGPKTFHGVMTAGFPNQFFMGYIQGALNASVTEQNSRQGYHIAHIISTALQRNSTVVEPTQAAQDAYVTHFEDNEIDTSAFQNECTPSYFNNEGEPGGKAKWRLFRAYAPGWDGFQALLAAWRAQGDLEGLQLAESVAGSQGR